MPAWVVDFGRYFGGLLVFAIAAIFSGLALVPAYLLYQVIEERTSTLWAIGSLPLLFGVWGWGVCLVVVLWKRLVFTAHEGEFGLFTPPIIKWAITGYLTLFVNRTFLWLWKGTPFLNIYLRMMGARIGRRVSIQTTEVYDWDLIEIDDDAMLGGECVVIGHLFEAGRIKLRRVRVGKGCLVGTRTTVMPGAVLQDASVVGANSVVTKGTVVPTNEVWAGTPARFIKVRSEKNATGIDERW